VGHTGDNKVVFGLEPAQDVHERDGIPATRQGNDNASARRQHRVPLDGPQDAGSKRHR
jgi:hypothetical protein